jgi:hypothetical protein
MGVCVSKKKEKKINIVGGKEKTDLPFEKIGSKQTNTKSENKDYTNKNDSSKKEIENTITNKNKDGQDSIGKSITEMTKTNNNNNINNNTYHKKLKTEEELTIKDNKELKSIKDMQNEQVIGNMPGDGQNINLENKSGNLKAIDNKFIQNNYGTNNKFIETLEKLIDSQSDNMDADEDTPDGNMLALKKQVQEPLYNLV